MSLIKKLIILCIMLAHISLEAKQKKKFTLVIDPAGDALTTGRNIQDYYERTIALQFAQAIKEELKKKAPQWLVLFTRLPGEQVSQLEKARFANQLPANLYISLHIYETTNLKSQLHLYYYANNEMDLPHGTSCIQMHKAHLVHQKQTQHYAHLIARDLSEQQFQRLYDVHEPIGLPCLPCKGIIAPTLCIEVGLKKSDDWISCIEPLTQALHTLCIHQNIA